MRELIWTNPAEAAAMRSLHRREIGCRARFWNNWKRRLPRGDLLVRGAVRALGGPPVEPITREAKIGEKRYRVYVSGRWNGAITQKYFPVWRRAG